MSKEIQLKAEKELQTKSSLLTKQAELSKRSEELIKEMQNREYEIDFKHIKVFNSLVKFLEKDAQWSHTTATGLIMLYNNMKQQKTEIRSLGEKWNGKIMLRSANVTILWSMVTKMTGSGFYEAKNFVELMASIGESLSNAIQKVSVDNAELREVHAKLNDIDSTLTNPSMYVNDTEDDVKVKTLADEVDPVIE